MTIESASVRTATLAVTTEAGSVIGLNDLSERIEPVVATAPTVAVIEVTVVDEETTKSCRNHQDAIGTMAGTASASVIYSTIAVVVAVVAAVAEGIGMMPMVEELVLELVLVLVLVLVPALGLVAEKGNGVPARRPRRENPHLT